MPEDVEEQIIRLNEQQTQLYQKGKYEQALDVAFQVYALAQQYPGQDHRYLAGSLNNLAVLSMEMGKYTQAEPFYLKALEIYRQILKKDDPDIITMLSNLASFYELTGNYSKAESHLREALRITQTALGEYNSDYAFSLNNLALFYYKRLGRYEAAEPLFRQAVKIYRKLGMEMDPDFANTLNNLAGLYESMSQYAAARPLYKRALRIIGAVKGEDHPAYATGLNNLAYLYESMGRYTAAERLYRRALKIRHALWDDSHPDVADSLNNLAELYQAMGKYSRAEPCARRALAMRRKILGEVHPDVAQSLHSLAGLYAATDRAPDALSLMNEASAINDWMIGQAFSLGSEQQRMEYLATLQGNFAGFLSLVHQYHADVLPAVRSALDLVLRRKAIGAEALAIQRDAILGGRYPSLAPELEQLTTLRTQIVQKTLAGPGAESIETHQQRLIEWNAQKERLEAELARQIPEMNLAQQLRQVNRHAIAGQLPHDALLVEFVQFDVFDFHAIAARDESQWKPAHYVAFVLPGSDPDRVKLIDLGEAEPIDKLIDDFRLPLSGEQGRDLLSDDTVSDVVHASLSGKQLRETIFDPLLPYLHEYHRLFLASDGNLSRLPFEVLPTEDGQRLIDHYLISYVSVGRDLLRFTVASQRQAQASVVMADPNFDLTASTLESSAEVPAHGGRRSADLASHALTFRRLPGTRLEGQQVAQALGAQVLCDGQAVVGSLKALRSPCILHLATHGFFLPDQPRDPNKEFSSLASQQLSVMGSEVMAAPDRLTWLMGQHLENPLLRSGLAFAGANTWNRGGELPPEAEDGLLTAEDVSGLDLLDTELVVLSACETGLGSVHIGEGVFGLRRTFVLAGAKTLVMSLWKVPDQQTQELMEDFYRRLLAGQSRAEALREAQLALKEKYPHPYFWGAFICQGNPGPLQSQ